MSFVIAAIGEVLWDVFPDGARFGGAPANVVSHAASLGARAAMVSCVGDDELGVKALEALAERGVVTDCVSVNAGYPTGVVNVELDASGKPRFTIGQPAAWDHLMWSEDVEQLAARSDAVCFGTLGQRNAEARQVIHQFVAATPERTLRVCDVNLRPPFVDDDVIRTSVELANVLKFSDEELDRVASACGCAGLETEVLASLLRNWDLRLVAVTRGSRGATLLKESQRSDCAGVSVTVRDTVGAGDSFTAAMMLGLLQGSSLDEINQHACRVAAHVCSQSGATPPLPRELMPKV